MILDNSENALSSAYSDGRAIVHYTDPITNKPAMTIQLSQNALASAIQSYQTNPNVYKGVSTTKLSIMGLNPTMSLGKAGATLTPEGNYVPKMFADPNYGYAIGNWTAGAGGGNYVSAYLSKEMQLSPKLIPDLTTNASVDTLGQTAAQLKTSAQQVYISKATTQIADDYGMDNLGTFFSGVGNAIGSFFSGKPDATTSTTSAANYASNLATRNYLIYKLEDWKYNQGLTTIKPAPVAVPLGTAATAAIAKQQGILNSASQSVISDKATTATAQSALNTAQNKTNLIISQAQQDATTLSTDQTAGKTRIQTEQNAVNTAQTQVTTYNQNLANTLHTRYINQYANAVDNARQTNTAVNLTGLINPTALYSQYAVSGGSATPPTTNLSGSGITFINGQPAITAALQQSAMASLAQLEPTPTPTPATTPTPTQIVTTGTSTNQKPATSAPFRVMGERQPAPIQVK